MSGSDRIRTAIAIIDAKKGQNVTTVNSCFEIRRLSVRFEDH